MIHFIIMFACLLPVCILIQLARSRRLYPQIKNIGADLVEAVGLAFALSLGLQGITIFPQWHSWTSSFVLFAVVYFPLCFLADRIRRSSRHDA